MWEFRNRNVFGATAFSTYGGFWLALGIFFTFATLSKTFGAAITTNKADLPNALAWFLQTAGCTSAAGLASSRPRSPGIPPRRAW